MSNSLQSLQGKFLGNGGGGGRFPVQGIKTLQLSSGVFVDAIIINGTRFGGNGGGLSAILTLANDEYIISINYQSGEFIDYISFTTSKGQTLHGGGSGGGHGTVSGEIYAIGGWSGTMLDSLEVVGFNMTNTID